MKFGLRLHSLLVPEWCGFYIDYNGLRRKIRLSAHSETESQFQEVYDGLSENIKSLQTFRQKKDQSLLRREAELCDPAVLAEIPITERKHFQLKLVLQSCQQISEELKLLESFDRINEAAADKLFAKLSKHGQSVTETHLNTLSIWERIRDEIKKPRLELHERINGLASQITSSFTTTQHRASSRHHDQDLHNPPTSELWDRLYSALKTDHVSLVLLQAAVTSVGQDLGKLPHHVFSLAVTLSSNKTLELLMSDETVASNLNIGSTFLSFFIRTTSHGELLEAQGVQHDNKQAQRGISPYDLFNQMLSLLGSKVVTVLQEKDASGCLPLHYAAKYGRSEICMAIAAVLAESTDPSDRIQVLASTDNDGLTPLHHAVVGDHLSTLATLIDTLLEASMVPGATFDSKFLLGDLLLLAFQARKKEIVQLLLDKEPDLGRRTIHGESTLYTAVQTGRFDYVQLLLRHYAQSTTQIDTPDRTLGWTPLMVACANGYKKIAELLLSAGANKVTTDPLGWTAQEHAAFRGHLAVSELFGMAQTASTEGGPAVSTRVAHDKWERHCCTGQKLIIIVIGSVQSGHGRAAVELGGLIHKSGKFSPAHPTSLEVSTLGAEGQNREVSLPLLEDQVNNPIVFQVREDTPPQLVVRVFSPSTTAGKVLVGSGTVLLDHGNRLLGSQRETLLRERTVFILDKEDMKPVGTVQVSYVVAGSFPHLQHGNPPSYSRCADEPMRVFGHRGSGQNIGGLSYLQLGENTAMSLLSAVNLGASFVEFDVQVTRDLEPVIYHNFSVSESGTEIPIHDMTLDQFMHACKSQEPRYNTAIDDSNQSQKLPSQLRRLRSGSTGNKSGPETTLLLERLQHTVNFKHSGFKANTRGSFIQDSLATLEDLLVKLPPHAGFNIEIKYSRLHEAAEAGMAPVAMELNLFVDTILRKVHQLANGRPIILSSFTPAVCMLLAVKQKTYPVMFITNAGKVPMLDQEVRAASLQMAMKFAKRWGLSGLVLACDVLLHCPRLVRFVKNAGLVCATYGTQNSVPAVAKLQADAGVDIIITDRVKLISQTLNSSQDSFGK